jgi:hypothetical protein
MLLANPSRRDYPITTLSNAKITQSFGSVFLKRQTWAKTEIANLYLQSGDTKEN